MSTSPPRVETGAVDHNASTNNAPSKLKTYGFEIAIIFGLAVIGVSITGAVGFFHVGALSNLAQINAIIMMATRGGGGIVLLIVGIVGTVKNRQNESPRQSDEINTAPSTTGQSAPTQNEEKPRSVVGTVKDTRGGLVYGAEAYKAWNMEVVEAVPEAPPVDWQANDPYFNQPYSENYVQLYFAKKVKVNGETKVREFDLPTMQEVGKGSFSVFNTDVATQFNKPIRPGWKLVSKKVIPKSESEDFETQKKMAEEHQGFRMLHVLEAIVLNLMVFKLTGERLYGQDPWTYTRCNNLVDGKNPVVVGGFGSDGLIVYFNSLSFDNQAFGVAVILEF